jgi:seryl-tRNA synthetase
MLTLKQIKEDKEKLIQGLKKRNWSDDELHIIDDILEVDKTRRASQTELDQNLAQVNSISKEIGLLFKQGKREEAEKLRGKVISFREKIKELEEQSRESISALDQLLLNVPNTPHELVPGGNTDEDNQIVKNWDKGFPDLGDNPLAHWDLAEKYKLIDFKLGVKLTGSGFPVFRGKGAKLERALIWFFLDEAIKAGYEEFIPPLMVNADSARATGQLPDKEGQMYHITEDNFYMIPTAEVPVTNIYRNSILKETDFPIKLTAYSPCFRREAGSYGSDVKGLNRVHQFDKVEIVQMAHPDKSYEILDEMLDHVEGLLKKLELPYRILRLCGGDLGFTSALTYDFEVYSAAQKRWLEVSSVSNFETYQSNRLKLRFKGQDGKMKLAHTLNGSALALARIVAAILENNQTADGIKIPEALIPLTGFSIIN